MAEDPYQNPMNEKVVSDMNDKLSNSNTILKKIAEESNMTGESIGELLKNEKALLESTKETNKSIKEIADSNRKMAQTAEEEKRETQKATKAGTIGLDATLKESIKKTLEGVAPIYAGATAPLIAALKKSSIFGGPGGLLGAGGANAGILGTIFGGGTGFLVGFLTPVVNAYKTLFSALYTKIRSVALPVVNLFGQVANALYKTFMETFPFADELKGIVKYIGNVFNILGETLSSLLKPITNLFSGAGAKLSAFLSGDGILFGAMKAIQKLFGEGALNVFVKAFEFGAKVAKFLPFLSVIPTAIETVVSAFSKFETEGFSGVFKTIMVGLLKGVAAFFTLGLSDLVLDFEKMYASFSSAFDGIFEQLQGFATIFMDIFDWLYGSMLQLWEGILKPIFMSLWNDAIKPLMSALSAVGDFVMALAGIVFAVLKPVLAIAKFVFKMIFEIVKLVYDFIIYPILSVLVPVFKGLFKVIGFILYPLQLLFEGLSFVVNGLLDFIKPALDFVTELFDAGTEMGSLGDLIGNALSYFGEIISEAWDFVYGVWDTTVGLLADGILIWAGWISEAWDFVYGVWDTTVGLLADGILIWAGWISEAWDYIYNLWDTAVDAFAYGFLWWGNAIQEAWDYIMGLWNGIVDQFVYSINWWKDLIVGAWDYIYNLWDTAVDAFAYGFLWWGNAIQEAWDYIMGLWDFAIDTLAGAIAPYITDPVMEFFDMVASVWETLKGYLNDFLGWLGFGKKEQKIPTTTSAPITAGVEGDMSSLGEAVMQSPAVLADEKRGLLAVASSASQSNPTEDLLTRRRRERAEDKARYEAIRATFTTEDIRNLKTQMSSGEGAAGGAGISTRSAAPIIINNSPTTNVSGGGGGAIPVPLTPSPIRHADPTRALIAN